MARPLRIQYPGAYYHVTCRGNKCRKIFLDDHDRYRFLKFLSESLEIYQAVLYGYVLMSNHFHVIVQTIRANLSEFMRRLNICYTGWFNYRHKTCGHLFQGRYKALLVDADNYLLVLSRYIHLNPVRVGKLRKSDFHEQWRYLKKYRWSSLPGYLNTRKSVEFVVYDMVLEMVGSQHAYQRFMIDGLRDEVTCLFDDVQYQTILGNNDFVALVQNKYIEKGSLREQPVYRDMVSGVIDPEVILRCVIEVMRVDRESLARRERCGLVRGIAAEMLYRYSGLTQVKIGGFLGGIDYGAVYQLRRRLKERFDQDKAIGSQFHRVDRKVREMLNVEI